MIFKYIIIIFCGAQYLNIVEHGVKSVALHRFNLEMSNTLYWFSLLMLIAYIVGMAHYLKKIKRSNSVRDNKQFTLNYRGNSTFFDRNRKD